MKVIVSGGGTGGHIYPAIAIIDELKKRVPDAEILYIGTPGSMEERIVTELGMHFRAIRVMGLPRKFSIKLFKSLKELIIGLFQAKKVISDYKPDLVIGTGGFVSGPVLFISALMGKNTLIHEQNSLPGVTNRILSGFVKKVAVTYESSKRYFKKPERVVVTGNPIRASLDGICREDAMKKYEFNSDLKTVFSFGGSNGSEDLNDAILEMILSHREGLGFQLIHGTGNMNYEQFKHRLGGLELPHTIKIYPYLSDIGAVYSITDLVIASSGAITLAEISSLGVPSILVPKAYTTENHQEFNARLYEDAGAALVILEDDLNGEVLYNRISAIISDENSLKVMSENSKKLGNPNATNDIVNLALELFTLK